MTTITIKENVTLNKTIFGSFDQAFSYLFAKNLISPTEIGLISKKEMGIHKYAEHKAKLADKKSFKDITNEQCL